MPPAFSPPPQTPDETTARDAALIDINEAALAFAQGDGPSGGENSSGGGAASRGGGLRVALLGWSVWLLMGWVVVLLITPHRASAMGMMLVVILGLVVVYPMVRLSLAGAAGATGATGACLAVLKEVGGMVAVGQAVVWPLMAIGRWPVGSTFWLNGWVCGWALIAGALTAAGLVFGGAWRTVFVGVCVLLVLGQPALDPGPSPQRLSLTSTARVAGDVAGASSGAAAVLSPIPGWRALSVVGGTDQLGAWPARTVVVWAAAALVWGAVVFMSRYQRRQDGASMPPRSSDLAAYSA